jgi:hypothetical protein
MSVTKETRPPAHSRIALRVAALLVLLAALACSGDEPSTRVTSSPTGPTPSLIPAARALELEGTAVLYGADPGDNAGAVASGDFNGDGIADVAFASAFADGPENNRPDAGEAYIFLGPFQPGQSRDAAADGQQLTVYGGDAGDQLGRGIAAGDIDGDGVDDLALGAPFGDGAAADRKDSGEVHILYGSPQLTGGSRSIDLLTNIETVFYGARSGDLTGFVLTIANLNGDSARDVIIGAFGASGPAGDRLGAGAVHAVYGEAARARKIDLATGEQDVAVHGAASADHLGEEVASGDVTGDGFDDLILPAPFAAGASGIPLAGRTYVIHSPVENTTIDLSTTSVDSIIYGVDDGDQLGHSTSSSDVDGDGRADILLTAVSADGPGNSIDLAGEAVLVYASQLAAAVDVASGAADILIYGAGEEDRLGRSAATADIDGDGRADLLIGAPGGAGPDEAAPAAGEIYVLLTRNLPPSIQLPASALIHYGSSAGDSLASEVFGRPALIAKPLNQDDHAEIIAVAPAADGPDDGRTDCGEVLILFPRLP